MYKTQLYILTFWSFSPANITQCFYLLCSVKHVIVVRDMKS